MSLDEAAGLLLHLPREAPGGPTGGRPFGQARQLVAMAQALNGAGRGRRWAGLGVDLRRTPGRMALGQFHQGCFLRGCQPIGGPLWPGAVIRQGPLEGRERPAAPFIEDAAAHAETGRHVGDRLAPEQREDGLEAVFPGGDGWAVGSSPWGVLLLSRRYDVMIIS